MLQRASLFPTFRPLINLLTSPPHLQVFAVKAKFSFPFGKSIVGNYYNFVGIFAGACLGMFIVYTPPLHVVFGGSVNLSPLYWLIPMAFGVLLLVWASLRVILLRKSIENAKVGEIKGLMMCKCPSILNIPSHTELIMVLLLLL